MSPPPKIIKAVNFQARRAEQRSLSFLALVMSGPLFQIDERALIRLLSTEVHLRAITRASTQIF